MITSIFYEGIHLSKADQTVRVATDIGGTFTDVVVEHGSKLVTSKVLTTPRAPEQAVIEGVSSVLSEMSLEFSDIDVFLHGTTLATNAIIERKGARTALIATDGFRDVLEIADESRYDQYDVFIEKPATLVARPWRFTVSERIDVEGTVLKPLDESGVVQIAQQLRDQDIQAVAIAFIHAYANAVHETRAGEIIREHCPDIEVTLSSEVCPEAREYERTSTAVANAYVQPLMAGYLQRLSSGLKAKGFSQSVHLMTSGGNLASLETARRFPIRLVESGPAGGAILAAELAAERDEDRILSFDMGGTTAKICLIEDGTPLKTRSFEVDRTARFMKGSGLPVRIPVIEMIEIGAGGGSIAQVDELGRIQVGPHSAGSEPGPACYGLGGEMPTVTDGDIMLGKIDAERFAGGKIAIHLDKAAHAVETIIGKPMAMDNETAAFGIVEIVDENMANAARVHAIERGIDLAGRTLVAFGGAAPLHACRLAEKLRISRVLIPNGAGVGSAIGFLRAPVAYEAVRSRYMTISRFDPALATELLASMSTEVTNTALTAAPNGTLVEKRGAYMRYAGQGHEIYVELPLRAVNADDASHFREVFEAEYRRLFNRQIPGAEIEIMSWSVGVSTAGEKRKKIAAVTPKEPATPVGKREVFDPQKAARITVDVYDRASLSVGQRFAGPAILVESGTSTLVSSSFDGYVDAGEALVLTSKESKA